MGEVSSPQKSAEVGWKLLVQFEAIALFIWKARLTRHHGGIKNMHLLSCKSRPRQHTQRTKKQILTDRATERMAWHGANEEIRFIALARTKGLNVQSSNDAVVMMTSARSMASLIRVLEHTLQACIGFMMDAEEFQRTSTVGK